MIKHFQCDILWEIVVLKFQNLYLHHNLSLISIIQIVYSILLEPEIKLRESIVLRMFG